MPTEALNPWRHLALAVINNGLVEKDWSWFRRNDETFRLWCDLGEVAAAAVQEAADRHWREWLADCYVRFFWPAEMAA